MKKLTQEDVDRIGLKPLGRVSKVRSIITNMHQGDIVLLEPIDWKDSKRSPSITLRKVEKVYKRKFTCHRALDNSGWIVQRLE